MRSSQDFLKSSAARVAYSVISAASAFFMMPFLVGHLGERWYGVWVMVASLVSTSYLLDLGLSMAVIRFVAKHLASDDTRGANEIVNTCLAIYAVLGAVVFAVFFGVGMSAPLFVQDQETVHVVRAVTILFGLQYATEFPFKAFAGIVSSYVRYDLLMLSRLLNLIVVNGAFIYLLTRGYGIISLAVTVLLADQLSNFLYYRIARSLFPQLRISPSLIRRDLVRELFSYSSWSFVVQLANQFRYRADSLVIGSLISTVAVTHYAIGIRLVEYLADFVYKATNMMTPIFTADFVRNNHDELRRNYLLLTRVNATLALFGGGMMVILGETFIVRWMGPSFRQSYPVLVILMVAVVFEVIGAHADSMLYAVSKHRYLAVINVGEAIVNLALSIALAAPLGIVGVALGTAIPMVICRIFIIPHFVGRFIGLPTLKVYRNLLPVTAFAGAYLLAVWALSKPFLAVPSYTTIAAIGVLATPGYVIAMAFVGFDGRERGWLLGFVPAPVKAFLAPVWAAPGVPPLDR